ncbi:signal peptidase I [Herbiconiux sp. KACC 21604]|uniref:signal peptidase I n=1 Tax=unclassified Herbiconiux TaxID=2618217 RepID=UPI0014913659|nr:signal peptidase I [Herbiconiux sp. SALV-R1]QJU52859.1 signal peptidase I [Herbiconiux sp. SALV-R1]WPO87776.1 signal peptidase I [Herbiconiux sp. KACC 21604]
MTDTSVPSYDTSDDTAPERRPRRSKRSKSAWLFARDLLVIFVIALLASVLIKTFLVRSFYIPSGSMENTLQVNDRILVNQLEPALIPISRGDVVVFKDPGGWLNPTAEPEKNPIAAAVDWVLEGVGLAADDANDHLIKRVIGLPGDTVACCNALGQMTVNDVPLDESAYLKLPDGVSAVSQEPFEVTVPADSLWVMGDNRYNSADSRFNQDQPGKGFVPIGNVVGRAILVTWPMDHWTWLDNYGAVFDGIPTVAPAGVPAGGSDDSPATPESAPAAAASVPDAAAGVIAAPALPGAH